MSGNPFDKYPYRYDHWYDEKGLLHYLIELEALKELGSLPYSLEVGVGTGRFAEPLHIEIGVDISWNMLHIGRERIFNPVYANGYKLPFRNSIFKIVYLIVTICFVDKPELILREVNRVLEDEGRLIVGYIPRDSIWGRYYISLKKKKHVFYSYAKFYSSEEVISILHKEKFEITRVLSTLFQSPNEVRFIEKAREGLYKDAGFIIIETRKI